MLHLTFQQSRHYLDNTAILAYWHWTANFPSLGSRQIKGDAAQQRVQRRLVKSNVSKHSKTDMTVHGDVCSDGVDGLHHQQATTSTSASLRTSIGST